MFVNGRNQHLSKLIGVQDNYEHSNQITYALLEDVRQVNNEIDIYAHYLQDIVRVNYPIRLKQHYLRPNIGNNR